jgi:hypothetical protein
MYRSYLLFSPYQGEMPMGQRGFNALLIWKFNEVELGAPLCLWHLSPKGREVFMGKGCGVFKYLRHFKHSYGISVLPFMLAILSLSGRDAHGAERV